MRIIATLIHTLTFVDIFCYLPVKLARAQTPIGSTLRVVEQRGKIMSLALL